MIRLLVSLLRGIFPMYGKIREAVDSGVKGVIGERAHAWLKIFSSFWYSAVLAFIVGGVSKNGTLGFVTMLVAFAFILAWKNGWRPRGKPEPEVNEVHVGGSSFADATALVQHIEDGTGQQIMLGNVPLPREMEPLGVAVVGSPGSGKSQLINGNLPIIRSRGERAFVLDQGGEAMSGWMKEGDLLLSPIDERAKSWSPFAEIGSEWDCLGVAKMIVGPDEGKEGFKDYAAQILGGIFEKCMEKGETKNRNLLYWATQASQKDLGKLLKGTPASRLFEEGNERYLGTILGILGQSLGAFRYLDPEAGTDSFSLKKWIQDSKQTNWVWVPYRPDQADMLRPLMQCWTEVVSAALLSNDTDLGRRIWIVIDELASAGHLVQLPQLAALGRKKGVSMIVGFQSIAQIDKIYGEESRNILKNCLQTTVGFAVSDAATSQFLVDTFGKTKYKRKEVSDTITHTADGPVQGVSTSWASVEEDLLLAADFERLPVRTAFLKLKGMPATHIQVGIAKPEEMWPLFIPKRKVAAAAEVQKIEAASQPAA